MSVCHVQSTPAGLLAPDHCGAAARPLVSEKQRLPRKVFRRSIAWLSDSLCTLRSAGYPRPTQHSLPAVGQTLLDGLCTRRVPMRGFRVLATSHPPLPSLPGAIGSTEGPNDRFARFGRLGRCIDRHLVEARESWDSIAQATKVRGSVCKVPQGFAPMSPPSGIG